MIQFPDISPVAFSLGPVQVHWYGLTYLMGFLAAWWLGNQRCKPSAKLQPPINKERFEFIVTAAMFGVIIGARLGYVLFYDFQAVLHNPLHIFKVWQGGMSFHGGLLGVLCALFYASRKFSLPFFAIVDFIAPLVPPGLFFGRLGNFINGELWGKITTVPWGMVFPDGGPYPRHPSQLYEALLEGLLLFALLWIYSSKKRPTMAVSGFFAIGYGVFRSFVEFFRMPDAHIGYLAGGFLTMGMLLCIPLIAIGIFLVVRAYSQELPDVSQSGKTRSK